jgi:hypothetical protein
VPAGRRARRCSCPHFRLASKPQAPVPSSGSSRPGRPGHHEASDTNGAFARTVSAIPGPSTRMAAATSATSRVSMNATLSSPACPPQVGGSRWWESVRTMSASTCASPASLLPPDTWPSWPVPPATAGRSSLTCRVLPRCRRADSPPAASCLPRPGTGVGLVTARRAVRQRGTHGRIDANHLNPRAPVRRLGGSGPHRGAVGAVRGLADLARPGGLACPPARRPVSADPSRGRPVVRRARRQPSRAGRAAVLAAGR